mmetsp:Transcript_37532/g.120648  ORF Transcript_37532/g.120648 Transcript_37532/m.120648 type:complete len:201 (+) Transcript_37532:589-1191(+)
MVASATLAAMETHVHRCSRHHQLRPRYGRDADLGGEDLVDDAVIFGLFRRHEEVAVAVVLDLVHGLPGVVRDVLAQQGADEEDLLSLDLYVGRLPLRATEGLVNHDARVWQRAALALLPGAQQEGAHRGGRAEADRVQVTGHILHRVKDGHAGRDGAAWRVDVHGDILTSVLVGQVEELRHKQIGHLIVHALSQQEDPVL